MYVTGISYSVHQTSSVADTTYDGSGFNSGPFGTAGKFKGTTRPQVINLGPVT